VGYADQREYVEGVYNTVAVAPEIVRETASKGDVAPVDEDLYQCDWKTKKDTPLRCVFRRGGKATPYNKKKQKKKEKSIWRISAVFPIGERLGGHNNYW